MQNNTHKYIKQAAKWLPVFFSLSLVPASYAGPFYNLLALERASIMASDSLESGESR